MKRAVRKRVLVINVRKVALLLVTVLMCVLALVSVIFFGRRFLKVKTFEVVGISRYEQEEIVSASGVKRGDALYLLDEGAVEEKILKECPYLESVSVKQKFPNRLRFEVVGKEPAWYLDIAGSKYTLDPSLTVIAEAYKTDGVTKLMLPNIKSAMVGQVPEFGDSETEIKKTLELIVILRSSSLKERLTEVNLENRWDIRLVVDGRYEVDMGDMTDFEEKLQKVILILEQENVRQSEGGSIVIVGGAGGYTGAFSPASPTEEEASPKMSS